MIFVAPLIAGIEDFIGILVFVLFLVISIVGQLLAKVRENQEQAQRRQAQQRQAQRPQAAGPAPRPAPGAQARAGQGQDPLKDEIGEFLRRAAERRGAAPAQPARRPAPAQPPVRETRPARETRPVRKTPAPRIDEPVEVELVEVPSTPSRSAFVPTQGATETARLATERLGRDIDQADERMAEHLHQVFDHQVGTLQRGRIQLQVQEPLPQTTAAGLASMVADPVRLRQAILLNEILERPVHRWE